MHEKHSTLGCGPTPRFVYPLLRLMEDIVVYFIKSCETGRVKIGNAKDVERRLSQLQTGCSEKLIIWGTYEGDLTEKEIHNMFEDHRIRGEWFEFERPILEFILLKGKKYPTYYEKVTIVDGDKEFDVFIPEEACL